MSRPPRSRPARLVVALVAVAALSACGGDADGSNLPDLGVGTGDSSGEAAAPTDAPPATDAPPVTDPPPPTEAPTTPTTPSSGTTDAGGDDSNTDVWIIAIIIGALILIAIVAIAAFSRKPKSTPAAAPVAPTVDPRRQLTSTARWVHDSMSLELLAAPVAEARQRWATERSRLDQMSIDARAIGAQRDPQVWQALSTSIDQLKGSIDTSIRVRSAEPPDAGMIRESTDIVNRNRGDLLQHIAIAEQTIL